MKNYYNKQGMNKKDNEEIVLPPGSDKSMFEELGKPVEIYENTADFGKGGSINQTFCKGQCSMTDQKRQLYADNLSGEFGVMSIPPQSPLTLSITEYLTRFIGKYICLDLWTIDGHRSEKCGMLTEIGRNFLVIRRPCSGEMCVADLNTVRYISIYCR